MPGGVDSRWDSKRQVGPDRFANMSPGSEELEKAEIAAGIRVGSALALPHDEPLAEGDTVIHRSPGWQYVSRTPEQVARDRRAR